MAFLGLRRNWPIVEVEVRLDRLLRQELYEKRNTISHGRTYGSGWKACRALGDEDGLHEISKRACAWSGSTGMLKHLSRVPRSTRKSDETHMQGSHLNIS